jgi:outer membrane beta-barrel protein
MTMRTHTTRSVLGAAVTACLLLGASTAGAERRNPLDGQPAIRYRKELRRLRLEITPSFTTSINQDYRHAFGAGGTLVFNFFDWLGIGFEGSYLFNTNTALEDKILGAIDGFVANNPGKFPGGQYDPNLSPPNPTRAQHEGRVLGINATMAPFVQITPFSGKFALFSAAFAWYDLYAKVGLGLVNYRQTNPIPGSQDPETCAGPTCDPNLQDSTQFAGMKVGAMIGVGAHLFFTDWIGLQIELRDYIVKANPGGGDVDGNRRLNSDDEGAQNNIFFTLGLTFVLPPKARITH